MVDDTVDAYVRAWREHDPDARAALLERCWALEGEYRDPHGLANGRAALAALIDNALRFSPGRLERTGRVARSHECVSFPWRVADAAGTVMATGWICGQLGLDGRVRRLVGFWDAAPEPNPTR